jgi:ribosomal-protein-alanine N-acetyltransferase
MLASRELHQPWLWPALSDAEFDAMLARSLREEFATLLVRRSPDGALAGYFSLSNIIRGALQSAFLGYGAVAAHAGRGYMSEGLARLLDHVFGPLGLHRIEANIQPANERSRALVRAAGFRCEGLSPRYLRIAGEWRDHERWAMLAEEWLAAGASRPERAPRRPGGSRRSPRAPRGPRAGC